MRAATRQQPPACLAEGSNTSVHSCKPDLPQCSLGMTGSVLHAHLSSCALELCMIVQEAEGRLCFEVSECHRSSQVLVLFRLNPRQ